jgi:hypothetical protein
MADAQDLKFHFCEFPKVSFDFLKAHQSLDTIGRNRILNRPAGEFCQNRNVAQNVAQGAFALSRLPYGGRFGAGWHEEAGDWPERSQGHLRHAQGGRAEVLARWPAGEWKGQPGNGSAPGKGSGAKPAE